MTGTKPLFLVATAQQLGTYPSKCTYFNRVHGIGSETESIVYGIDDDAISITNTVRRKKSCPDLRDLQQPPHKLTISIAPIRGLRGQRDGAEPSTPMKSPPPHRVKSKHVRSWSHNPISSGIKSVDRLALFLAKSAPIQAGVQSQAWQVEFACRPFVRLMTTCDISALRLKLAHAPVFSSVCVTDPVLCGHPIKYYSPDFRLGPRGLTIGACMFLNLQHGNHDDWSLEVQLGRDGRPHFILEWSGRLVGGQGHLFLCSQIDVTDSIREMAEYERQRRRAAGRRSPLDETWDVDWTKLACEERADTPASEKQNPSSIPFSDCPVIGPFLQKVQKIKAAHKRYFMLSPKPNSLIPVAAANPPPSTQAASLPQQPMTTTTAAPSTPPSRIPTTMQASGPQAATSPPSPRRQPSSASSAHSRRSSRLPLARIWTAISASPSTAPSSTVRSRATSAASFATVTSITTQSTTPQFHLSSPPQPKPKPKPFSHSVSYVSPSMHTSTTNFSLAIENMGPEFLAHLEQNLLGDKPFRTTISLAAASVSPSAFASAGAPSSSVAEYSPADSICHLYATPVSNGGTGRWRAKCWVCFLVDHQAGLELGA